MSFVTKCGHCNGTTWETKEIEPRGSRYKQFVVQCFDCGVPVGVLDYYNLGTLLHDQEQKIKILSQQVMHMQSSVDEVLERLRR